MQLPSVIFCQFYFDSFDYTLAERLLHRHLLDIFESWLFFNLIFDTSRGFIFIKCVSSTVRCLKRLSDVWFDRYSAQNYQITFHFNPQSVFFQIAKFLNTDSSISPFSALPVLPSLRVVPATSEHRSDRPPARALRGLRRSTAVCPLQNPRTRRFVSGRKEDVRQLSWKSPPRIMH